MSLQYPPFYDQVVLDQDNNLAIGATLEGFYTDTLIPAPLFNEDGNEIIQPLLVDSDGRLPIYKLNSDLTYRLVLKDVNDVTLRDANGVKSGGSNSSELVSFFSQVFTEDDLSVDRKLTITHNLLSEDLIINLFDDDKKVYLPDEYQVIDVNNVEVTIDATVVGTNKIVICGNANSGSQTTPSVGGFMDYNDTSTTNTPINLSADTWTTIPNDGLGAFTNKAYKPDGNVVELIDTATGSIDPTGLTLGDTILIRNDFTVVPNTNNASLQFRYQLGSGAGSYTLEKRLGRLDEGSGSPYRFSLSPDLIYMGDTNTRDNPISLQVKLSTNGTLVNAGSVIQLISYHRA